MSRLALAWAPALALLLVSAPALAQAPASEATVLQGDVERYASETEGSDCAAACRALGSMRRAADRLCDIEPGDACARAQATLRRSTARVRAACPECVAAQSDRAPPGAAAPPMAPPEAEAYAVQRKGGGCAGCTVSTREEPRGLASLVLAVGAVAWANRRRRRR